MGFLSKTAAFMGMASLRDLVSDSIAIDLGSAATIIYEKARNSEECLKFNFATNL